MNLTLISTVVPGLFFFIAGYRASDIKTETAVYRTFIAEEAIAADTFVNYCRLVRAAFFYGQKSTEQKVLSPADLEFFNDNWRSVFDVPYYQAGITADEFLLSEPKLREGNHAPFPPSVRYHKDNADTYLLFHVAKEAGKIQSPAYFQCPTCVQESINKINELLAGSNLHQQVSKIWLGTGTLKKINSAQDVIDFWLFLRCLTIDERANPVTQTMFVSLPPVVKCPDTTFIQCKDEIKPKVFVGYRHCEVGGKIDTLGPVILHGIDNCPGTVYAYTFTVRDQCLLTSSARQYFKIKNDPPSATPPYDTIVDCIENFKPRKPKAFTSCDLPAKVRIQGPKLVAGQHNCPYAEYHVFYTLRDTCGRETEYKQRITIQNDEPTIECPPDTIVECIKYFKKGSPRYKVSCFRWAEVTSTTPVLISGKPDCDGSIYSVMYTVKDSCDRSASCLQQITIRNKGPEIECPQNQEVLCEEDIRVGLPKSVKVACDLRYTVTTTDPKLIFGKKNCQGAIYSVTYKVTDECGRTDECDQLFTILQPELLIQCPPDKTVTCYADIVPTAPAVTIACKNNYTFSTSPPVLVSGQPYCHGAVYKITYTVSDQCGVVKQCDQKFTIDHPAPEIVCYPEGTFDCYQNFQYDIPVPVVSCKLKYDVDQTEWELVSGNQYCDGARYKKIFTVTDECGRSSSCTYYVRLKMPLPEVRCAPDEEVECEEDIRITDPTVKVECQQGYDITDSGARLVSGKRGCPGAVYVITYTVEDDCKRKVTCDQRFTIKHDPPTIDCPEYVTVECEEEIVAAATIDYTSSCGEGKITYTGPELFSGKPNCDGAVYIITYVVTDPCGHTADCIQQFTIQNRYPDIDCPPDRSVRCESDITPDQNVTAYADCPGSKFDITGPLLATGTPNCPGAVYKITYRVTDVCGRYAECTQKIILTGDDFSFTCPPGKMVKRKVDIRAGTVDAASVCGVPVQISQSGPRLVSGGENQPGSVYEIEFTITDHCGRSRTCVQQFQIEQPEIPDCPDIFPNSYAWYNPVSAQYECICPEGYQWNADHSACEPIPPDCSGYPGARAKWDAQQGKFICACDEGYTWDATQYKCVPIIPDCSIYPGTTAVWDQVQNKYICACAQNYTWDATQNKCVPIVPDCSVYPGTSVVWDQAQNKYICACAQNYTWDATQYKCVPIVPDCSVYPGTTAVWDQAQDKYVCSCAQGYTWDATQYKCVPIVPDCSVYPGTTAVWDQAQQKYICSCAQGYAWDATQYKCVPIPPDCSVYPGTTAVWDQAQQKYICSCAQGYTWDAAQYKCVPMSFDCSQYPGTTAVWDYAQNKWVCACAQGYKWNPAINMCVYESDNCTATWPNSYLVLNAQGQWQCVCIPGYQWNGTACVSGSTRDDPPVNPQQQHQGVCNTRYESGADEPEQYTIDVGRATGKLTFSYNTESIKDRIHVYYNNQKIFDTGCVGAASSTEFTLNGYSSVFRIIVDPLCDPTESNTVWSFTLGCPQ